MLQTRRGRSTKRRVQSAVKRCFPFSRTQQQKLPKAGRSSLCEPKRGTTQARLRLTHGRTVCPRLDRHGRSAYTGAHHRPQATLHPARGVARPTPSWLARGGVLARRDGFHRGPLAACLHPRAGAVVHAVLPGGAGVQLFGESFDARQCEAVALECAFRRRLLIARFVWDIISPRSLLNSEQA